MFSLPNYKDINIQPLDPFTYLFFDRSVQRICKMVRLEGKVSQVSKLSVNYPNLSYL